MSDNDQAVLDEQIDIDWVQFLQGGVPESGKMPNRNESSVNSMSSSPLLPSGVPTLFRQVLVSCGISGMHMTTGYTMRITLDYLVSRQKLTSKFIKP